MTVSFYLPCTDVQLQRLPRHIDNYLQWQSAETELNPFLGRFHWVLQTQLRLAAAGIDVRLTNKIPDEGIVFSHVECFDYGLRSTRERLIVAALVDKDVPLPHAALHLTHNPMQQLRYGGQQRYMPPWPQIGLIPRDPKRGDLFKTLYFVGNHEHLHPFFKGSRFSAHLRELGLHLVIPEPARWHDFSGADAVLAIRNFGQDRHHLQRPALKLFNAWHAGVPALMGYETAYRTEGLVGIDFLEATTEDSVLTQLDRLAKDRDLRVAMSLAGRISASRFSEAAVLNLWIEFLAKDLTPRFASWQNGHLPRWTEQIKGSFRERLLWRDPGRFRERQV